MVNPLSCVIVLLGICGVISSPVSKDVTYIAPLYVGDVKQSYNKYIVKLTDDVDVDPWMAEINTLLKSKSSIYNISRVFRHAIKAFAADLHVDALDTIRRNTMVEFVEADVPVMHFGSNAKVPWSLDRIDQRNPYLNNEYEVDGDGSGVNVYVIDSGIHTSHEEFGDRAKIAFDALDGNGQDCSGHGTHCAGVIGSRTFGVAKEVNLFAIRTVDCSGSGSSSDVIEGLEWIEKHGKLPAVASISLGTTEENGSRSLDRAVNKLVDRGVTVVVAAGNSATDACNISPAKGDKVITVGATGIGDLLAPFSNTGACVDILAPGASITSTWYKENEPIRILSGTSMACPHVAGAAAIILSKQPHLKPEEVKRRILEDATPDVIANVNNACVNSFLYIP